ncbi:family 16 glycosylhydrolase [Maribacter sp. 2210JD10-5]|uniref:glycoside hydrolase family 16 protein n=1 Tax=Maribacter sp. 2210JD10-5 TaxID=3386272 RepID=UPI0039BCB031
MKNSRFIFLCIFTIIIFVACSGSEDSSPSPEPEAEIPQEPESESEPEPAEWNLVFEDEFDTDLAAWNIWEGGAFNNEIQLYNTSQAVLENGILTITAKRETAQGPNNPFDTTPKDFEYISSRIEGKVQYGPSDLDGEREYRFAARIKLPKGDGMWPAFWSYADPWPTQGEIDILEARGNDPMRFQSNIFYGTQAGQPLNDNADTEKEHELEIDLTTDFHEYELIWKSDSLEIVFDGEVIHTYIANSKNFIAELFEKKQQIVFNLAVGGDFFIDKNSANYTDMATMQIDWVRVYKR